MTTFATSLWDKFKITNEKENFLFKWSSSTIIPFPFLLGNCLEDSNFVRFHSPRPPLHSLPPLSKRDKEKLPFFSHIGQPVVAKLKIPSGLSSFSSARSRLFINRRESFDTVPLFFLSLSLLLVCTVVAIKRGPEPLKWLLSSRSRLLSSYPSLLLHPRCSFQRGFRIVVLREIVHDCTILKQRNWWSSLFFFCFDHLLGS